MGKIENISNIIIGIILGIIIGLIIFNVTLEKFVSTTNQPSSYFGGELNKTGIKVTKEDNIRKIIIPLKEGDTIGFGEIEPTGSMRECLSDDSLTIELLNFTEKDLQIGDMISVDGKKVNFLKSNESNLLHRIIDIKEINGTIYYQTQGDNNQIPDKNLWFFEDIRAKIIGILYVFRGLL